MRYQPRSGPGFRTFVFFIGPGARAPARAVYGPARLHQPRPHVISSTGGSAVNQQSERDFARPGTVAATRGPVEVDAAKAA